MRELDMCNELDEQISDLKDNLLTICEDMNKTCSNFIESTTLTMSEWFAKTAEDIVVRQAEHTNNLGHEVLSELKLEVSGLQKESDTLVQNHLRDENLWWHKEQQDQSYYIQNNRRPPKLIQDRIRIMASSLSILLRKYKYERIDYLSLQQWPDAMVNLMKSYFELHSQALMISREINMLIHKKSQNQAKGLWDDASR